jgi:hypothetical protein
VHDLRNVRHLTDQALGTFQEVAYAVNSKTMDSDHRCPMKQTTSASQAEVDEELNIRNMKAEALYRNMAIEFMENNEK